MRDTKPIPQRVDERTHRYIREELLDTATKMLVYFAPQIDPEEFYRLVVPAEYADVMVASSKLMPKLSRWSTTRYLRLNLDMPDYPPSINFHVVVTDNRGQNIDWLWPEQTNLVTPKSKLGELLIPIIDLGIRWKIQMELWDLASRDFTHNMIAEVLPWLRTYISGLSIRTKNSMDRGDATIIRDIDKMLAAGSPRFVPGRSAWYTYQCRDGEALLTQYMFMRNRKHDVEQGKVYITPAMDRDMLPKELIEHHNEFVGEILKGMVPNIIKRS